MTIFTPTIITLLAILLLTLDTDKLNQFFRAPRPVTNYMLYSVAITGVSCFLNYYLLGANNTLLINSLYYIVIPIFGAIMYKDLGKNLLLFLGVMGVLNLIYILYQVNINSEVISGVADNSNWSSTLLLCSGIAIAVLISRSWLSLSIGVLASIGTLLLIYGENCSRGTLFAATITLIIVAVGIVKKHRIILYISLAVIAVVGIILLSKNIEASDNIRAELATATLKLIKSSPLIGHGAGRYEEVSPPFISESYYLLDFVTDRHTHPHNEILFWASTFGLAGVLLLASYAIVAFVALKKWRNSSKKYQIDYILATAIIFFILLIHGQVDVILSEWPCNTIFLLAAGMLWGYAADNGSVAPPFAELEESNVKWPLYIVQLVLAFIISFSAISTACSSYYYRKARLAKNRESAGQVAKYWESSVGWQHNVRNLYGYALFALYDLKDANLAISLIDDMRSSCVMANHVRSQLLLARAYAVTGDLERALEHFNLDQKNYPLSIVNLVLKQRIEEDLKLDEESKNSKLELERVVKKRGYKPSIVPYIMKNQSLDIIPRNIPKEYLLESDGESDGEVTVK